MKCEGERIIRCKLVCREVGSMDSDRTDLFAPSTTASTLKVIDTIAVQRKLDTSVDMSNAFLYSVESEEVYVDPSQDWKRRQRHPRMRWRMLKQLYGRRKPPARWADCAGIALVSIGREQCDVLRICSCTSRRI